MYTGSSPFDGLTIFQIKAIESGARMADPPYHDGVWRLVRDQCTGDGPWTDRVVGIAIATALSSIGVEDPPLGTGRLSFEFTVGFPAGVGRLVGSLVQFHRPTLLLEGVGAMLVLAIAKLKVGSSIPGAGSLVCDAIKQ
jgi:hypothetical protein